MVTGTAYAAIRAEVATHDKSVFRVRKLAERSERAICYRLHDAVIARVARPDREREIILSVMLIDERPLVTVGTQGLVIDFFDRRIAVRCLYIIVYGVIQRRCNHLKGAPIGRRPINHLHRRRAAGRLAPIQILLARIGILKGTEIERAHPTGIDDPAVQRINLFPGGRVAYGKI